MKLITIFVIVGLSLLALLIMGEGVSNIIWDEYEEDCNEDETFKFQSYLTKVGECLPKEPTMEDVCTTYIKEAEHNLLLGVELGREQCNSISTKIRLDTFCDLCVNGYWGPLCNDLYGYEIEACDCLEYSSPDERGHKSCIKGGLNT